MIPASIPTDLAAFQDAVQAAKPIAALTPLQLNTLVAQGRALVEAIDAAVTATGAILDRADPTGHPLDMIRAVRIRLDAATDATLLADLRGLVGRAVLNLSAGVA